MLRALNRFGVVLLLFLGVGGHWYYYTYHHGPGAKIAKLEEEKKELEQIVKRLGEEQRVAQLYMLEQDDVGGVLQSKILFIEYGKDGKERQRKHFTVKGEEIYVAGLSIRFNDDYVMKGDAMRGKGILLFTRIFGREQSPADGTQIDKPGEAPIVYAGEQSKFEQELWKSFWRLVDDKSYRAEKGVEVASGKAVFFRPTFDRVYKITLDVKGNPTVDWEPVPPILLEAMKKPAAAADPK